MCVKLILEILIKICQEISNLLKVEQKHRVLLHEDVSRFCFAADIKSPYKRSSNEIVLVLGRYNSRGGANITRTHYSFRLYYIAYAA